jgi:hypothetical protein
MKLSNPIIRMLLILMIVPAIDCVWVLFASRPLPMAAIIPATIPIWVSVFVIPPILKEDKRLDELRSSRD